MLGRAILSDHLWTNGDPMSKVVSSFELSLKRRARGQTLANWLYTELRAAILDGRLKPGLQLPATRDFARRYKISRGTVVSAFERLQDEGYLSSHVGVGTKVSAKVLPNETIRQPHHALTAHLQQVVNHYRRPKPFVNWVMFPGNRPFSMRNPALNEFPAELWGRLASRRTRRFASWLREEDDGRGYRPLREAVAHYLGSSRGVRCDAQQVIIVSGTQQALDLLARLLLKPGDPVWMEDPGYFGASIAFERVGAKIIPVPVDEEGLSVSAGIKACADAKGVFLTPAHQFPLGMVMSLRRRIEVLEWAARAGSFVIEDDYDSEYQFNGQPAPALQGLDRNSSVIFIGTFTKLLFPLLRLGYVVLPSSLADVLVSFRRGSELRTWGMEQAILCDFIVDGHFGRHLRKMRELYTERLETLLHYGDRYLGGLLKLSDTKAGLYIAGFLQNGMTSHEAESISAARGLETRAISRFTLKRHDPGGLLLGFASFDEKSIRNGTIQLAAALGGR
jgi:GntR family transcriptional regulator/MocR family aminotransferase